MNKKYVLSGLFPVLFAGCIATANADGFLKEHGSVQAGVICQQKHLFDFSNCSGNLGLGLVDTRGNSNTAYTYGGGLDFLVDLPSLYGFGEVRSGELNKDLILGFGAKGGYKFENESFFGTPIVSGYDGATRLTLSLDGLNLSYSRGYDTSTSSITNVQEDENERCSTGINGITGECI